MTDRDTLDKAKALFTGETQGDILAREVIAIAERASKKAALWEELADQRALEIARKKSRATTMNILRFLALCLVTGFACTTWATCEPPPTEQIPYKRLEIKRPAEYRPLVSMTGSKP